MTPCTHETCTITVNTKRLVDDGEQVIGRFVTLSVVCKHCGEAFYFPHFPPGPGHEQPQVSNDGTELRVPIKPGKTIPIQIQNTESIEFN